MNTKILSVIIISAFAILSVACGGTESNAPANANGANVGNTNTAKANTNNPLAVTTPTPEAVTNNAPTLTPVYKAYCAAMVKKDEAAIRKFYTADTLQNFEQQMKDEGTKLAGKISRGRPDNERSLRSFKRADKWRQGRRQGQNESLSEWLRRSVRKRERQVEDVHNGPKKGVLTHIVNWRS